MGPQVSYYWAAVERIDPTVEGKDSVVGSVLIKRNIYCTVREIRYFLDSIKRNNLKSQVLLDLFASVSKVSHSLRVEASTVEGSTPTDQETGFPLQNILAFIITSANRSICKSSWTIRKCEANLD